MVDIHIEKKMNLDPHLTKYTKSKLGNVYHYLKYKAVRRKHNRLFSQFGSQKVITIKEKNALDFTKIRIISSKDIIKKMNRQTIDERGYM